MKRRSNFTAFLAAAFLLTTATAHAQTKRVEVRVVEYCWPNSWRDAQPLAGAEVTFTSPSERYPSVTRTTDAGGRATFDLRELIYELSIKPPSGIVAELDNIKTKTTDDNREVTLNAQNDGKATLGMKSFGDMQVLLARRECTAQVTPPKPLTPPRVEEPCGPALAKEYDRLLGARRVLRNQRDELGDPALRPVVDAAVERLDAAAVAAAKGVELLAPALDNAFLQPIARQIEQAVKAGASESAKRKLANDDLAGAALDGIENLTIRDEILRRQGERKRLQAEWIVRFQREGRLAKAIARQLPPPTGETLQKFTRQIDDIDLRLDKLRGIAEETRCALPASMIARDAANENEAVLLGLTPPLDGSEPGISEDEALLILQMGFMYSASISPSRFRERTAGVVDTGPTAPITGSDVVLMERIGRATMLGEIFGPAPDRPLEDGPRAITSVPGRKGPVPTTRTPEASITPSGTAYLIHRDRDRRLTFVHVSEGSAEVAPRGGTPFTLAAGQSVLVTDAGKATLASGGTPSGSTAQRPAGASALVGCYRDTSVFDLDGHLERSPQNTPQRCIAICRDKGYDFAGMQYGESCLCGNSFGRYGPADNCDYACTGDAAQKCGGYNANSVYRTRETR